MLRADKLLLAAPLLQPQLNLALTASLEHIVQTFRAHLVARVDQVVVGLVDEGERNDTLLLEVGLVDTGEALGQDDATAEVPGLEGGVFSGAALAVVMLGDDEPFQALVLPALGELGNAARAAVDVVSRVGLAGGGVDGTNQSVLRDVGQVALVLEPRAGSADGVGGALALDLVENAEAGEIRVGEGRKRLEKGETRGLGVDLDLDTRVRLSWSGEKVRVANLEPGGGEVLALRRVELEGGTRSSRNRVSHWVESGAASITESSYKLGGSKEVHGSPVAVVSCGEVTVVAGEDSIGLALLDLVSALPLANTRT